MCIAALHLRASAMAHALLTPAAAVSAAARRPSVTRHHRHRHRSVNVVAAAVKPKRSPTDARATDAPVSEADPSSARPFVAKRVVSGALACVMATSPVAATILAAEMAAGLAAPQAAEAALSNPNTRLPRNGVAALRRAVPDVNREAGAIQSKLEEAAYLLRIPQRKPWGTMVGPGPRSCDLNRDPNPNACLRRVAPVHAAPPSARVRAGERSARGPVGSSPFIRPRSGLCGRERANEGRSRRVIGVLSRACDDRSCAGTYDEGDDVKSSLALVRDKRAALLEPAPTGEARTAAEATLAELDQLLTELVDIAGQQDVERFDRGVAMALDATSRLRVLQAPGLPFDLPRRYDALPRLTGRAVVDLTVRKGAGSFGFVNGDEVKTVKLRVVVDGYNAPLTAGNFVDLVKRGYYNNRALKKSETALLVDVGAAAAAEATAAVASDDAAADGVNDAPAMPEADAEAPGAAAADRDPLPLEVKPLDDYEPRYRSPLNVMGAEELPTLPLSVNGALAMARGGEDGTSSPTQFFVYQFDKRSAGLGGLAFEEGEFSVFGYVVQGEEEGFLNQLTTGDVIVRADVVEGGDRLVKGQR